MAVINKSLRLWFSFFFKYWMQVIHFDGCIIVEMSWLGRSSWLNLWKIIESRWIWMNFLLVFPVGSWVKKRRAVKPVTSLAIGHVLLLPLLRCVKVASPKYFKNLKFHLNSSERTQPNYGQVLENAPKSPNRILEGSHRSYFFCSFKYQKQFKKLSSYVKYFHHLPTHEIDWSIGWLFGTFPGQNLISICINWT